VSIFARKAAGLEKVEEVEGEIRELLNRGSGEPLRRQTNDSELVTNNLNSLLQRVSGNSLQEIDRLIIELKVLRERLQREGERVAREIVGYASLSEAAMQSTKIIAETLTASRKSPDRADISE
jgi:hypothetical protein